MDQLLIDESRKAAIQRHIMIDQKAISALHTAIICSGFVDILAMCVDDEHNVHPREIDVNEVGLRIRVDDTLRSGFIETCKANDTTASQVLRAYMRLYLEEHGFEIRQGQLFNTATGFHRTDRITSKVRT